MGPSPTVMQRRLLRLRPRACLHVGLQRPRVRGVDWTPCPLDLLPGATVAPSAVGCPSPELRPNWDWPRARARPH
jgi:hypothetical protein